MRRKKGVHPVVKIFLIAFLVAFFGGGLLIFVNNLIVPILPDAVAGIIGGIIMILFIVLLVVSKCVSAVKAIRPDAADETSRELQAAEDTTGDR